MDYFSELLSSYDKLKKRTFKLTYISEAEKKKATPKKKEEKPEDKVSVSQDQQAEGASLAQQFMTTNLQKIQQGTFAQKVPLETGTGVTVDFWMGPAKRSTAQSVGAVNQPQGTQVIKAKSGKDFGEVGVLAGNSVSISPQLQAQPEKFQEFVGKFVGDADTGDKDSATKAANAADQLAAQQEAEQEALRQEKLKTIGGWSELNDVEMTPDTLQAMRVAEKFATNYCSDNQDTESLKNFCSKIWTYFAAGNSRMGLEYKLGTAQALSVTDPETGMTKKTLVSPGLREQAARSNAFLVSFLRSSDEQKCQDVTSRIGMYKGEKLVLFGQEPNEGIVVGEPNALQKLALDAIARPVEDGGCGISKDALTQLIGDGISGKEKNAVKGTFFEAILVFSGKVRAATTPAEAIAATEDLKKILNDKKATLLAIFRDMNPEAGMSIDGEFDLSTQEEALAALGSPQELNDYIMRELRSTQPFIDFMSADDIIHGGKVSKTGQRSDINFAYKDIKTARAKAKEVGSSVIKKDGMYVVPVGLKRLQAIHGTKFGEINSQERLDGLITGRIQDANVEAGFESSMAERQFGGSNTPRQQRMVEFADALSEEVNTATQQLVENQTYIDSNGKIKSQTPASVFGQLAKVVLNTLSFGQIKSSLITKAFFNLNEDGEPVKKDFDGDGAGPFENRERGRELVGRSVRMHKLKTEIEAGNQAARDYVIKAALVTGSNKDNMTQVIVDDTGEMVVFKHNEIFDIICAAENDPNSDEPTFVFDESRVHIKVGNMSIAVGQENASMSDAAGNYTGSNTRTECRISTGTIRNPKLHGDIAMPENSSLMHKFIAGQMELLETLLNQTT